MGARVVVVVVAWEVDGVVAWVVVGVVGWVVVVGGAVVEVLATVDVVGAGVAGVTGVSCCKQIIHKKPYKSSATV